MNLRDDELEKVIYAALRLIPHSLPDYDASEIIASAIIEADEERGRWRRGAP